MKVKVSEASGPVLDWMVAKCEGVALVDGCIFTKDPDDEQVLYVPSTDWAQGGPIIERERIGTERFKDTDYWSAFKFDTGDCEIRCETPLIAAMRCYCCSKLGDIVDVPEELCQSQSS